MNRSLLALAVVPFVSVAGCVGEPPAPCTECGDQCVDLQNDARHCGQCDRACASGSVCRAGACSVSCSAGLTACGGTCADTRVDAANCGTCGNTCPGGQACVGGSCSNVCPAGQTICSASCVTLATDDAHCGMCGRACGTGERCNAGSCAVACPTGQTVCGGACVTVASDSAHCGMCGRACAGNERCSAGTCTSVCGVGLSACPGAGGSTLCAQVASDPSNCGACGVTCRAGTTCQGGQCLGGDLVAPADAGTVNLSVTNLGGRTCSQGGEMVRYAVTALTSTTATVTPAPAAGCLGPGDEVLLINLQGTPTATANVGNHELLKVASISGGAVTFTGPKVRFYGEAALSDANLGTAAGTQRVMLQRVPAVTTFDSTSARLTADEWSPASGTGGVFALRATRSITLGPVDMRGKGYEGGPRTTLPATSGRPGESVGSAQLADGGVVDLNNFGAGGGGRGDATGCIDLGTSGGGAGHLFWGQRGSQPCSGRGGGALGNQLLTRLYLGSGGAAGGTDVVLSDNPPGGRGGRGGGIVLLLSPQVTLTGPVDLGGLAGEGDAPGASCGGSSLSTTSCWDFSGPGGGGAGGSFLASTEALRGRVNVRYGGGAGGLAGNGSFPSGNGGRGSPGRVLPLPRACGDINRDMGDGEYLFALDGDPERPFVAYCLGNTMYLTLHNRGPGQNRSVNPGVNGSPVITTTFQRVRFDPASRRIFPSDFTFASSTYVGTTTGSVGYGIAAGCTSPGSASGSANIDLRGLPFALSASNVWTVGGFLPAGSSSFSFDRQVASITGGGFCGDNLNRVFPNAELELDYLPPRASCEAVKAAYRSSTETAVFALDVGPLPALPVSCDLSFDSGGWALLGASVGLGPNSGAEVVPVVPGTRGYVPASVARLLAEGATRVHLRTAGQAATRSFTTVASSAPIVNLRLGLPLNADPFSVRDYTGPMTTLSPNPLDRLCPTTPRYWPNAIYHACGNGSGLHWLDNETRWSVQPLAPQESLELYVR